MEHSDTRCIPSFAVFQQLFVHASTKSVASTCSTCKSVIPKYTACAAFIFLSAAPAICARILYLSPFAMPMVPALTCAFSEFSDLVQVSVLCSAVLFLSFLVPFPSKTLTLYFSSPKYSALQIKPRSEFSPKLFHVFPSSICSWTKNAQHITFS